MLTFTSILATTGLLSLAMLLVLGSLLRSGMPGIREWFAANAAMVVSIALLTPRGLIPDFVSVVVANGVLGLAGALYYGGCALFLRQPPYWRWTLGGAFLQTLAIAWWRYASDDIPMRVLANTTFNTVICVAAAVLLLRHRPPERRPYNYWFAALLALTFGACQAIRGIYFMSLPPQPSTPMMFNTVGSVALLAIGAVILPTLTMACVMLVHDAMMANLEESANHDYMTGAMTRKRFETLAQKHVMRAAQSGAPLALLIIDLDHFKRINDTLGHAAGDEVLREFARMTRQLLREEDLLGRLGGEEFGIILPRTTMPEALKIAERLRAQAEAHIVSGSFGQCRYTISIGLAALRSDETFDILSSQADLALYAAKHSGRNQVVERKVVAEGLNG